jgi:hypothetical protein
MSQALAINRQNCVHILDPSSSISAMFQLSNIQMCRWPSDSDALVWGEIAECPHYARRLWRYDALIAVVSLTEGSRRTLRQPRMLLPRSPRGEGRPSRRRHLGSSLRWAPS